MKSPESQLLFQWQVRDRSLLRLLVAAILTVVGFVSLFVVFRVVAPESRPVDVRPQQILVLNPQIPAERALIHFAMDRSFALVPTEMQAAGPGGAAALPRFTPSFAGQELRLKPLPSTQIASARKPLFALDMDVLPPLPAAPETPTPAMNRSSVLKAVVEGELAARLTPTEPLKNVALADAQRPRFRVAVGSRGEVLMALPLFTSDDPEVQQKLHAAVLALRFTPASPAEEVQWGQVSFQWEVTAP